ncbi:deoxyribodipyrimidine photo-lyase [Paenibacillus sp. FSL W8-1187]|uniref:Deoxyribodipyrimidine photolyase n=1 Tax=Paenibacillus pasadenensis TaxID=217090 RepID=A0A2N5N044_9BACL|nr:deoxyribodipyrimidine photo-lyase [Paenibacillus pasadenensis]PLT43717.1 Deoxyribodipyrimidine photolyase [Paenibacillus pasadenensis]
MYLFIHRKDLRAGDLRAFDYAASLGMPGIHALILDPAQLGDGRAESHPGRHFLRAAGLLLRDYAAQGAELQLLHGNPALVLDELLEREPIREVVVTADHTPYARRRDERLAAVCRSRGVRWTALEDVPLADLDAFQEQTGRKEPYRVFTPFYRAWNGYVRSRLAPPPAVAAGGLPIARLSGGGSWSVPGELAGLLAAPVPEDERPERQLERFLGGSLQAYEELRDRYALDAGSGLSRWLNVGALSARRAYGLALDAARTEDGREPLAFGGAADWRADAAGQLELALPGSGEGPGSAPRDPSAAAARSGAESWIRQLAWREFYLYQARFDADFFRYEEQVDLSGLTERHAEAWRQGRTGIPLIDAAMTQLRTTGELPNRLRMIAAMFLCKNLLAPFTAGERWFREQLLDYDATLNRGGWLWSSSLGFDAAPYFRIMNPVVQSKRWDPDGAYIRRWLPERAGWSAAAVHEPSPQAVVDLKASRARAIETYKRLLAKPSRPLDRLH